jgi:hypothetical protein
MIIRKHILLIVVAAISFVVFLTSCYKIDPDDISGEFIWKPDISLPLGETAATLKDNESGQVKNQLRDTVIFILSDIIEEREQVDSMIIRLNIENEFPVQWNMFVFYVREGEAITDYRNSLTGRTPIAIRAGKIDQDTGKSTIPSKMTQDIPLHSYQVDGLYHSNILVIRLDYNTAEDHVNDDIEYRVKTQIALQAKLNMAYE